MTFIIYFIVNIIWKQHLNKNLHNNKKKYQKGLQQYIGIL